MRESISIRRDLRAELPRLVPSGLDNRIWKYQRANEDGAVPSKGMSPKTDTPTLVPDREVETEKSREPSGPRIRCPLCGWSPHKEDKWFCTCGHEWNTFDTGGVCPACLHQWTSTQCLSCSRWSPHSDWYAQ